MATAETVMAVYSDRGREACHLKVFTGNFTAGTSTCAPMGASTATAGR